jgi:hypothetical protein
VIDATIKLRKQKKVKLPDAIIAATVLVNNFTTTSRNVKDFQDIEGLYCLNLYAL